MDFEQVWILFGKNDEMFRGMWERAMDEMLERLIHKTTPSGFTYVAELARNGVCTVACGSWPCAPWGRTGVGMVWE